MPKDNKIFLQHILESIDLIQKHTKGLKQEDFIKSWPLVDASIHRKEIPWWDIIGMRNVLIHEYFNIDEVEVWKTIKNDLPKLKKYIKKIV